MEGGQLLLFHHRNLHSRFFKPIVSYTHSKIMAYSQCPGQHLAEATLWITIATVLAVFNIEAPIDPVTGERKTPSTEVKPGLIKYVYCL